MVILKNTCDEVAPSTSAASKSEVSIPIIPAISRIVVLPNHIRKFMKDTSDLELYMLEKNLNGEDNIPICISMELIRPPSENKVKNNIANADAMIRFGRYITVLKNLCPLSLRLGFENQDANSRETIICGIKPITHMIIVFLKY